MGRAENKPMKDASLEIKLTKSKQFVLVQDITKHFWEKWTVEVTPEFIVHGEEVDYNYS